MNIFEELAFLSIFLGIPLILITSCYYVKIGQNSQPKQHNWAGLIIGGTLLAIFSCLGLGWVEEQVKLIFRGSLAAMIWTTELPVIAILGGVAARFWRKENRQWNPPARIFAALALTGITHAASALLAGNVISGIVNAAIVGAIAGLYCSKWFRDHLLQRREDRAASRAIIFDPTAIEQPPKTKENEKEVFEPVEEEDYDEDKDDKLLRLQRVVFWHAVVEVTRGPAMLVAAPSAYPQGRLPTEGLSWLAEYHRGKACGLRITSRGGVKMEFFARCDSEWEAVKVSGTMLEELKHRFRGLHGKAEIRRITYMDLMKDKRKYYCELCLPAPPYQKGIAFFEKLVDIGRDIPDGVECNILWHRPSWWEKDQMEKKLGSEYALKGLAQPIASLARRIYGDEMPKDPFMARIYVTAQQNGAEPISSLLGRLSALKLGIVNTKSEDATWRSAPLGTHLNLLKCRFRGGHPIAPAWGRFDFPDNLKLPRGFILVTENFHPLQGLSEGDSQHLILGDALVDGAPTRYLGYVKVNNMPTSGIILGTSGSGKSTCLAYMINQLAEKCPEVGIMILNVGKAGEETKFPFAKVIRWDDDDFGLPWFVKGAVHRTACESFAFNLSAALGLKRPLPHVVQNTLAWLPSQNNVPLSGPVPTDFHDFVQQLRAFQRTHKYAPDTQADIVRMIDNRIARLDTPEFCAMTRLDHPERFQWFRAWLKGRHVFLDLVSAPRYLKKFIVYTLFQMIREVAPQAGGVLRNLLVIDEAHVIFPRPLSTDPDDEEVVSANYARELIGNHLDEFRSRGHAILFSDQEPVNLLSAAYEKPSLKILFHLPAESALLLLPASPDRPILHRLPQYEALVLDGSTGQCYCIQTRPPLEGTEQDAKQVENTRTQKLGEGLDRLEGKIDVPAIKGNSEAYNEATAPEEVPATMEKTAPEESPRTMDGLEQELIARASKNSRKEMPKEKPKIKEDGGMEEEDLSLDALEKRVAVLGRGSKTLEETPQRTPHNDIYPPPPESLQPRDISLRDPTLEGCTNLILHHLNFIDPALAIAPGQAFLDRIAKVYWNSGQPQLAYRFKFAQYHNLLHKAVYGYRNGPARANFFVTAHAVLSVLNHRSIPLDGTLLEELVAMRETHEYLLRAPKVNLKTFQQAVDKLRRVTQGLAAQLKDKIDSKGTFPATAIGS